MGTTVTLENTEYQNIDRALKFLGLTFPEILDQFPEGVFVVNTRWQLSYFNHTAQQITGFSREEALGKFCWEIFQSELCHKRCPMRLSMNTGEHMLDCEVEILTKTGQKRLILVNTSQIIKGDNLVLGGVETFHDLRR